MGAAAGPVGGFGWGQVPWVQPVTARAPEAAQAGLWSMEKVRSNRSGCLAGAFLSLWGWGGLGVALGCSAAWPHPCRGGLSCQWGWRAVGHTLGGC